MENELKTKAIKDSIYRGMFSFIAFTFFAAVIVYIISVIVNISYLKIMVYVIAIMALIFIVYIIKKVLFINKSKLTYGTIIRVEKSDSDDSQAYQNYIVEYVDESNNQKNQTIVYELFGDNDDVAQKEINNFFEEGQKIIGKRVPLLYIANNPKKTMVFMKMLDE